MARRSKHDDHEEHASEAWLIAFADMMTLLMVTFLMMFAISSLDLQKFKAFQQAFQVGLGKNVHALQAQGAPTAGTPDDSALGAPPKPAPTASTTSTTVEPVVERKDAAELEHKLEQAVAKAGLASQVTVSLDDRGVVVYVTSGVLFDSGSAMVLPAGATLLSGLAPVFAGVGNELDVEGHTDDRPISSAVFPSNWELSTARSSSVLRSLIGTPGIDPRRISASGFADTRPRVPNDTPEHRAENRRVEVVVVLPQPVPTPAASAPATPATGPGTPATGTGTGTPVTGAGTHAAAAAASTPATPVPAATPGAGAPAPTGGKASSGH